MKKKTLYIIVGIAGILVLLALIVFLFADNLRFLRVKSQLKEKYGVSFEIESAVPDQSVDTGEHFFRAVSGAGVRAYGFCDWKGTLISDSYVHYYYADRMNEEVNSHIASFFDECIIVRDCLKYGSNLTVFELPNETDTQTYADYKSLEHKVTVTFRVYLKKGVTETQLRSALDALKEQGVTDSVYFLQVSDDAYEMISKSGLECYYPHFDVCQYLKRHTNKVDATEIDEIVLNPEDYTVAQYIPKYDVISIETPEDAAEK